MEGTAFIIIVFANQDIKEIFVKNQNALMIVVSMENV
jgi:hypothetical protein